MNIFNLLAGLIDRFLSVIIGLFPVADSGVVSAMTEKSAEFRGYLESASYLFPVNSMFTLISFVVVVEVSLFSYRLVKLVVGYISGGFLRD